MLRIYDINLSLVSDGLTKKIETATERLGDSVSRLEYYSMAGSDFQTIVQAYKSILQQIEQAQRDIRLLSKSNT